MKQNHINLDVMWGATLDDTVNSALTMVKRTNRNVCFNFNGVEMMVTKNNTNDELIREFHNKVAIKQEKYLNSTQYKIDTKQRVDKVQKLQTHIDKLLSELKSLTVNKSNIIKWIGEFAAINDDVDLIYDKNEIVSFLKEAGYKRNDEVGNAAVHTNSTIYAKWLIGQAIDNLESGMPIHPIATKFCKDYFDKFASVE